MIRSWGLSPARIVQIEDVSGIRIVLAGVPQPALCAVVGGRFRHQG